MRITFQNYALNLAMARVVDGALTSRAHSADPGVNGADAIQTLSLIHI